MIDLPLYLSSFEYDTQKELIQQLLDELNPCYLREIDMGHRNLLSAYDVEVLQKYQTLCNNLGQKPSTSLLQQTFPTLSFVNVAPLKEEQLREQILLDINKLKTEKTSNYLMYISSKLKSEGMSSELLDEILQVAKVDISLGSNSYKDLLPDLKGIYEGASLVKGIEIGVKQIDDLTGGFQPGTFNCIAGFAGAGKTTAAVNVAYNALKSGKNVCYLTLEVPKVDMYYNFGSRHSFDTKFKKPISHSIVKKKELTKQDTDYFFDEVLPDLQNLEGKLYVLDETDFESYSFKSFESKIAECDALATKETEHGIDLVIIDQAQLLKFSSDMSKAGQETSVINLFVSFFRQQSINFLHQKRPCTILMLSQINREGFTSACKKGGKYSLTNLAEANELERASAMVITVFTDESLKASKQVNVQLLKSRNGETLVEPTSAFMDPVYYVFGSDVVNGTQAFTGAVADLFVTGPTLDLNSSLSSTTDLLSMGID